MRRRKATSKRRGTATKPKKPYEKKREKITKQQAELLASQPTEFHGAPEAVVLARRRTIVSLLKAATPKDRIQEYAQQEYGMSQHAVNNIIREIRDAWRTEYEDEMHTARAATIQRLRSDLAMMRSQRIKPWRDIIRHENLLAKIEGTLQPVKLAVLDANEAMRDAMTKVLSEFDHEDIVTYLAEGEEVLSLPTAAE